MDALKLRLQCWRYHLPDADANLIHTCTRFSFLNHGYLAGFHVPKATFCHFRKNQNTNTAHKQ